MTILVTGATGPIGRSLVSRLVAAGVEVRATSRTPESAGMPAGVHVVGGDFATGQLSGEALEGVSKAFLFPALGGVDGFLARASAAEIEHLVVLSSLSAAREHERDHGSFSSTHHLAIESAVQASGIPHTILRPGNLANNLLFWAWPIKTAGTVEDPYPTSAQTLLHEADVAAVAAETLLGDGHLDKVYPLTGPEVVTRREQLATIGRAIGRELTMVEISPRTFRAQMSHFMPPPAVEMLLDYWSDTVDQPDIPLETVAAVTGRPARGLDEWATDHRADFVQARD